VPEGGGHLWVYLQYVHALRTLGCEVLWLERFHSTGNAAKDLELQAIFRSRMDTWGMTGRVFLYEVQEDELRDGRAHYLGVDAAAAGAALSSADLLLNFDYRIEPAV